MSDAVTRSGPPVVVLGVSRSVSSLLRHMLDHHSELAIPPESYFIPALRDRYPYYRDVDPSQLKDHARLREPATPGSRDWRRQMSPASVERFEAIAGDLLAELGYERRFPAPSAAARATTAVARQICRAHLFSGRLAVALVRRTPIWRLRHRYELRRAPSR